MHDVTDLRHIGKFCTVVIDPPWPVTKSLDLSHVPPGRGGAPGFGKPVPYEVMALDEIAVLPVSEVLADTAVVFCWTTRRFLPYTFQIVAGWGLKYRFTMVWHKSDGPQLPGGPKFNAEFCVVAVKGNPTWRSTAAFYVANSWPRRRHSAKPEGFYDLLRRVTYPPRLDIFGRRPIDGFHSWGAEAPQTEPAPDHYQEPMPL